MPTTEDATEGRARVAGFMNGLRDVGLSEGRNLKLDIRWGSSDVQRLRAFASELVALTPDVLLAGSTPTLVALGRATTTIPIVFVLVSDPVGQGFVQRRAALTPLDPLATKHTLLFDRGDDHAVPPQPSLLSSKPQTATAASIANTAAKRPSSAAHAKPRQRNASRPIIINSRSLVIRCKTARTGNVRARMWSAGSGLAAQLRLALDQWHCWIGPPPALSHLHRRLHRRSCRPPSRSLSHRRASERTALPALPTVQAL
jgi:ABC transporter substrate binding protein